MFEFPSMNIGVFFGGAEHFWFLGVWDFQRFRNPGSERGAVIVLGPS